MTAKTSGSTTSQLLFVPLRVQEAQTLASSRQLDGARPAVTANDQLCETFDLAPDSEEAELAALQVAALWSLIHGDRRLVGVFRVEETSTLPAAGADANEAGNGMVSVPELNLSQMQAFFAGADDGSEAELAAQLSDKDIDGAWGRADVQELAGQQPLLWHDASELGDYLSGIGG